MGLRTADKFKSELLGLLELEAARVRDDFEDASREVTRSAGADLAPGKRDAFQRGRLAWERLSGYDVEIATLERVAEIVAKVRLTE